jgi:hypothetical protein
MFKQIFGLWLNMWRSLPRGFRFFMGCMWLLGLFATATLIRIVWHFVIKYW